MAWRNGAPVRLEEVATPVDGVENARIAAWNVDKRAIVLAIQRQPGANTINTVESVKHIRITSYNVCYTKLLRTKGFLGQESRRSQQVPKRSRRSAR